MILLISPAKTMKEGAAGPLSLPVFEKEAEFLAGALSAMSFAEAKAFWKTNDALTEENRRRIAQWKTAHRTAAILSYDGIQFRRVGADSMDSPARDYLTRHVRILSGLYGVLRPFDGIAPYRLEMKSPCPGGGAKNLYAFWGRKIYDQIRREGQVFLNLSSSEYSRAVLPFASREDRFISVDFLTRKNGALRQQSTYAKMGRGEMVRFLAEEGADTVEAAKRFSALGFSFAADASSEDHLVFVREG